MSDKTLGLIGTGQMARALARGFVARQLIQPNRLYAFDPEPTARSQFTTDIPESKWAQDNKAVVKESGTIILAVKPQSLPQIARELEGVNTQGKLFISILAGVPIAVLCRELKTERVIRVMSNTPCLVGQAASAYSLGGNATADDGAFVEKLFSSVGIAFQLPEKMLDAVTGLSGSGPAYMFMLIEALSDGGVRMGLPRNVATKLAAQTMLGAAQLLLESGEHPGVLKDRVASPAGTTIAGLQILERRGVRSAMIDAVEAATHRSLELGSTG